ncbi:MAG: porin, partial [Rhabdaerophilum sp.]
MVHLKSIGAGVIGALAAIGLAQGADLGVKKPSAAEYVKTCPTYGSGFFVVPGTTSCLKVLGRVRADTMIENPTTNTTNANRFRVRGYVAFDHRTATEYGLLRTFVRAYFQRENAADTTVLEQAFIQFGGITAGRVTPLWEHGWSPWLAGSNNYGGYSFILYTNTIGYTAKLGSGFSATLAIEDSRERIRGLTGGTVAGTGMPDIVGSLDYAGSFGALKLMGALHEIRTTGPNINATYGYAIGAAGKINLPFASKGTNLWFNAVLTEGAVSYAGYNTIAIGSFSRAAVDATVAGGKARLTQAWTLAGGVQAYLTPTIWTSLGGSYAQYDPSGAANTLKTYALVGQVGWQPTAGFLIGAEVFYRKIDGPAATITAGFGTRG